MPMKQKKVPSQKIKRSRMHPSKRKKLLIPEVTSMSFPIKTEKEALIRLAVQSSAMMHRKLIPMLILMKSSNGSTSLLQRQKPRSLTLPEKQTMSSPSLTTGLAPLTFLVILPSLKKKSGTILRLMEVMSAI